MSWIGRKIYKYLKECEEFNKDLLVSYVSKKDNLGEPPRSEEYQKRKTAELLKEYFEKTPKEKVLEDWNSCRSDIIFGGKTFAGIDKRKVGEEMSNAKGCLPRTECLQPAPKQNGDSGIFVWFDEKGIKHSFDLNKELVDLGIAPPPAPERVSFEKFKNNRKKMNKEIRHEETCIITSVENNGVVSITIEPKKGFGVSDVSLNVGTAEILKEPVLPKELLSPKPELQTQYNTLAKLIATRDYYNSGHVFNHRDRVYCICSGDVISVNRYECEITPLFFKDGETAQLFQKNFRNQIESVKHLI